MHAHVHTGSMSSLRLHVLAQPLAVCRLEPLASIPAWVAGDLVSVTRTTEELSIVCAADAVPLGTRVEGPFRALVVDGPLDLALTGVMASLTTPLARADVPVFVLSTFDTDLVLVPADRLAAAVDALEQAGHVVARP